MPRSIAPIMATTANPNKPPVIKIFKTQLLFHLSALMREVSSFFLIRADEEISPNGS
jgi:hypothetical protein